MRIDEGHRRQRARFRQRDKPSLRIVEADDVLQIEGVLLEEAQEGVEVLEIGPRHLALGQTLEDRVGQHRPKRT